LNLKSTSIEDCSQGNCSPALCCATDARTRFITPTKSWSGSGRFSSSASAKGPLSPAPSCVTLPGAVANST
jgi:hypothetical protein